VEIFSLVQQSHNEFENDERDRIDEGRPRVIQISKESANSFSLEN